MKLSLVNRDFFLVNRGFLCSAGILLVVIHNPILFWFRPEIIIFNLIRISAYFLTRMVIDCKGLDVIISLNRINFSTFAVIKLHSAGGQDY